MDHDVYVGALPLDQELVVDSGKNGAKDLNFENDTDNIEGKPE